MSDNEVTNKDLLLKLADIKDNRLTQIQQSTSRTNWLLATLIVAVLIAPFMG